MSNLFENFDEEVRLLDPGCGVGSLLAAFVDQASRKNQTNSIKINAYEVDYTLKPYIKDTINICRKIADKHNIKIESKIYFSDFILESVNQLSDDLFSKQKGKYTHVIMNPPYKKIKNESYHRKALEKIGIITVNLYTAFLWLAIEQLDENGEIVAIIPRSFCNGLYYKPFRKYLLSNLQIKNIHLFHNRKDAFSEDSVLQENIILHGVKGNKPDKITISSSRNADFYFDPNSGNVSTSDLSSRSYKYSLIVKPADKEQIIHIPSSESDEQLMKKLMHFNGSLDDLDIQVSTGPVVSFRVNKHLQKKYRAKDNAPLIYANGSRKELNWPNKKDKPNAIDINEFTKKWLWKNKGYFVLTRRFSSKEEQRRIYAFVYPSNIEGEFIGFDNKLNVFHINKMGLNEQTAKGLWCYLNSDVVDKYYRTFGGHTQVNASDLRFLPYPDISTLKRIGNKVLSYNIGYDLINKIIEEEVSNATKD